MCLDSDSSSRSFCSLQQEELASYSTNITQCGSTTCSGDQGLDPATCSCAYPYTGKMIFRAPSFADPSDRTTFQQLETSLWKELGLRPAAVFLSDVHFSSDDYLQVQVSLFPSTGIYFDTSEVIRIGFAFSNQTYKPPSIFGPYFFIADPYGPFPGIQYHQCKLCPYLHKIISILKYEIHGYFLSQVVLAVGNLK